MQSELTLDAVASSSRPEESTASTHAIMQNYLQDVESGAIRSTLAPEVILNVFGRSVKGASSVTGFMRTQITNRYKHVGFDEATNCHQDVAAEMNSRFGRALHTVRRLREQKAREKMPSSLRLRADSDEEDLSIIELSSRLATPPRNESLNYVEGIGRLEATHSNDDGGIDIGDSQPTRLTLGHRASPRSTTHEICLVVYEKVPPGSPVTGTRTSTSAGPAAARRQRPWPVGNEHTDDESVEAPETLIRRQPRSSVRRTLFTSTDLDQHNQPLSAEPSVSLSSPLPILPPVDPLAIPPPPAPRPGLGLTPRKRPHNENSPKRDPKRPSGRGGMRF
ncbi:cell cycle negative regulator roughex [Scaptodrosophila lebanonensis]|uniref:Cell cycle negative regulator roughex n=1 Tax=Drosophila lebanonensis TaxID=7225 RepID=A0A6J2U1H9_DROLE|nr:cell cycle negative regulator roughex [Scaptodrosophila lebanonensis]